MVKKEAAQTRVDNGNEAGTSEIREDNKKLVGLTASKVR